MTSKRKDPAGFQSSTGHTNMVYAAVLPRISPVLADNPYYKAIVDRMDFPRPVK